MKIQILSNPAELGKSAAERAAGCLLHAQEKHGHANLVLATGKSQEETLRHLVARTDIDWTRVSMFHLDEYVGIDSLHPASFRRYLHQHFIDRIPNLGGWNLIQGDAFDLQEEIHRLNRMLAPIVIDLALVGIGENGHLAFNDPPADFDTQVPYLLVSLDQRCRRQQVGEGWFARLEDVPVQAISMSVQQIMKARVIVCSVPELRKAEAVAQCLEQEISNLVPASILRNHPDCHLFLDADSASMLKKT
jgi:glucosamine-6-phosphate deaminase